MVVLLHPSPGQRVGGGGQGTIVGNNSPGPCHKGRGEARHTVMPPSMLMAWAVMNSDLVARQDRPAPAISSACPAGPWLARDEGGS